MRKPLYCHLRDYKQAPSQWYIENKNVKVTREKVRWKWHDDMNEIYHLTYFLRTKIKMICLVKFSIQVVFATLRLFFALLHYTRLFLIKPTHFSCSVMSWDRKKCIKLTDYNPQRATVIFYFWMVRSVHSFSASVLKKQLNQKCICTQIHLSSASFQWQI